MLNFAEPRRRRWLDLTPMIDVVFLLLVFFMLVSRFDKDRAITLRPAGGAAADWPGPPRLIDLAADGTVRLNGAAVDAEHLVHLLAPLMSSATDPIILRPGDAPLQALVETLSQLNAEGLVSVIVME